MRKLISFIIITICFISLSLADEANQITNFRISDSITKSRFALDILSKADYRIYPLESPDRLVLDIKNATLSANLPKYKGDNLIKSLRPYQRDSDVRIVLDLGDKPSKTNIFTLPPSDKNKNYRIVVDLTHNENNEEIEDKQKEENLSTKQTISTEKNDNEVTQDQKEIEKPQEIVKLKQDTESDIEPEPKVKIEKNKIIVLLKPTEQKQNNLDLSDIDRELQAVNKIILKLKEQEELANKQELENQTNIAKSEVLNDAIMVKLKQTALLPQDELQNTEDDLQNIDDDEQQIFPVPVAILKIPTPVFRPRYKPMIVIDAGHGGRDPGAVGTKKTLEKDITLAYAKELKQQLKQSSKYDVLMVRETDVFLRLQQRLDKARSVAGDLFISLHVNENKKSSVSGFSIYTLSETASDKEAAALARKENKSGLINGINLNDESDELTGLLINMTQRQTKNISAIFAETIVDIMGTDIKLLKKPHRFAGFTVLTGADIPSVLIELGYITNRREEKLLRSTRHKKKLVNAIVKSIDTHFETMSSN